jgi:dipeptidyl aminopeptidase/acylaminoacyl peptidase
VSNVEYSPELAAALDRLVPLDETLGGDWEDVVGRVGRRTRRPLRPVRNRRLRLALVVAAILLLLTGVATATYFVIRASQPPPAVVALDGNGRLRTVWRCPAGGFDCGAFVTDAALAPDGRHLAFVTDSTNILSLYQDGLHVIDLATGADRQLPAAPPTPTTQAAQFRAWRRHYWDAVRFLGCAPPAHPNTFDVPAQDLAWSPDGSRLAYACTVVRGGNEVGRIYTIRPDGTRRQLLRTGTSAYWPTWSPDAKRVAFSTEPAPFVPTRATDTGHPRRWVHSAIYVVDLDGSHRQLVTRAGAAPDWSPDGSTIAYSTLPCTRPQYNGGRTRLVTPDGRDVTPRSRAGRCGGIGPAAVGAVWSPDGRRLAVRSGRFYVMDADGKHVTTIPGTEGFGQSLPLWWPLERKEPK